MCKSVKDLPVVSLRPLGHLLLQVSSERMHGDTSGPHTSPIRDCAGVVFALQRQLICSDGLHFGVDQQLYSVSVTQQLLSNFSIEFEACLPCYQATAACMYNICNWIL